MRTNNTLFLCAWLLLCLAVPALASEAGAPDTGDGVAAADDGGFGDFGDGMFSLEPVDPDLPAKIRKWNAECLACHSKEGLAHPPRQDLDLEALTKLSMVPARFDAGVHTGMACKECHAEGFLDYPHAETGQRRIEPCLACHPQRGGEIEKAFELSFHYRQHGDRFTCVSCHDAHYMQVAEKIRLPRAIALQDNGFCRRCHESELRFARFTEERELPNLNQVHDWLPNPELHWAALRCVDCHTRETASGVSHEILPKEQAEHNCVTCHSRDSTLRTRLYRFLVREDRLSKVGFLNGYVLTDAYVVGATRNRWLDQASFVAVALVLGGIALHAALRILSALLRRRRSHV